MPLPVAHILIDCWCRLSKKEDDPEQSAEYKRIIGKMQSYLRQRAHNYLPFVFVLHTV